MDAQTAQNLSNDSSFILIAIGLPIGTLAGMLAYCLACITAGLITWFKGRRQPHWAKSHIHISSDGGVLAYTILISALTIAGVYDGAKAHYLTENIRLAAIGVTYVLGLIWIAWRFRGQVALAKKREQQNIRSYFS